MGLKRTDPVDDNRIEHEGGGLVIGWQHYYGAGSYLVDVDSTWPDQELATRLGVEPRDLADIGIGTTFAVVTGVQPAFGSDDAFEDIDTWFAHGDPWHVLIGVGADRIVVGSVDMFEGGYAGPPALTCIDAKTIPSDSADLKQVADMFLRAQRSTARRMNRCPLCDSPRYGSGCRCDGLARGIDYD